MVSYLANFVPEQWNKMIDYSYKTGDSIITIIRHAVREYLEKHDK